MKILIILLLLVVTSCSPESTTSAWVEGCFTFGENWELSVYNPHSDFGSKFICRQDDIYKQCKPVEVPCPE